MDRERRYDFGMRGPRQTGRWREADRGGPARRAGPDDGRVDRRRAPRTPRVTARYNRDYVVDDRFGGRGRDEYPRGPGPYGGALPGQIGGPEGYRRPYGTIGGTRTFRGAPDPRDADPGPGRVGRGRRR